LRVRRKGAREKGQGAKQREREREREKRRESEGGGEGETEEYNYERLLVVLYRFLGTSERTTNVAPRIVNRGRDECAYTDTRYLSYFTLN